MKIYSGWYDRDSGELIHVEKDKYDSISHVRMSGALMAQEFTGGGFEEGTEDVWVAWDVRGVDHYLGVFSLSGDPVPEEDLKRIEAQASKYKKRWA